MKYLLPLAALAIATVACRSSPSTGAPLLPRLAPPPPGLEQIRLTARMSGSPALVRGCVRIAHGHPAGFTTVLWHPGTMLGRDRAGYFLRTADSSVIHRLGQRIEFGGGGMTPAWVDQHAPEVARRCGPPYAEGWLVD